jgi:hypothetical protein
MSTNEKTMKKQCKVFSVDEKMQILAKVDARMGTQVDPAAVLGLSVSTLHTIMSKWPEIEKTDVCCGPSFSKEPKSLKTSQLEELETICLAWFKQACATNTSITGPHPKEEALDVTAHLFGLQTAGLTILRKNTTWCTRLYREKVPL